MNKSSDLYRKRINKAINFINDNLNKSISLSELASVTFFSPFHFHRIFLAVTGETVNHYTNRIKLEKSTRLLKLSKMHISDISIECGFTTASSFSRSFKKYFGTSPSVYRKTGDIQNSKIRKELFPVNQYHCEMKDEELNSIFPIEIRNFPDRRIAYIRVLDSYKEGVVLKAFGSLINWAKRMNLFSSESIFGMSLDDPTVTPKEKYRYEVCITLPDNFVFDNSNVIETTTLPKCKYAVTSVSGDINLVATGINYLFNNWLINSTYEPEHQPGLEIFKDKENICNWDHFDLELCIPVKKTKIF